MCVKLSALQNRLTAIANEIVALSGTGIDCILEAIKNQRWYFFKNKTKVLMDRDTGLLWANLDYFPYGKNNNSYTYPLDEINNIIQTFNFDSFTGFRIPDCFEFWNMILDKTFSYHHGSYWQIKNDQWYWAVTYNGYIRSKDTQDNGATTDLSIANSFILTVFE